MSIYNTNIFVRKQAYDGGKKLWVSVLSFYKNDKSPNLFLSYTFCMEYSENTSFCTYTVSNRYNLEIKIKK